MVENNFVGWEIILSFEIYFRWSRNIFDDWENFFLGREIILFSWREILWKSRNIWKDRENFFIGQTIFFNGWEVFGRLRINFVNREFFYPSRIFLSIEKFPVDREIFLSIEKFPVDREITCQSRIFPSIDKLESVFRYPSEGGHLRGDKSKRTMFLWAN